MINEFKFVFEYLYACVLCSPWLPTAVNVNRSAIQAHSLQKMLNYVSITKD